MTQSVNVEWECSWIRSSAECYWGNIKRKGCFTQSGSDKLRPKARRTGRASFQTEKTTYVKGLRWERSWWVPETESSALIMESRERWGDTWSEVGKVGTGHILMGLLGFFRLFLDCGFYLEDKRESVNGFKQGVNKSIILLKENGRPLS